MSYYRDETGSQILGEDSETLHHDFLLLSMDVFSGSSPSSSVSPSAIIGMNELAPRRAETEYENPLT